MHRSAPSNPYGSRGGVRCLYVLADGTAKGYRVTVSCCEQLALGCYPAAVSILEAHNSSVQSKRCKALSCTYRSVCNVRPHVQSTRTLGVAPHPAGPSNTASPPPLSGGNTGNGGSCSCSSPYTVKPGDGMYAIAQRCGGGLTVASISAANGITNPDLIQPGQKLVLPGCGGGSTGESFCMTTRAHTRVTGCHAPVSA